MDTLLAFACEARACAAVITTADRPVSMAAGAAFLHEEIAAAPPDLAAEGLSLAVTVGEIIALAQRAPGRRITDGAGPAAGHAHRR
jgi:hypothetical protein